MFAHLHLAHGILAARRRMPDQKLGLVSRLKALGMDACSITDHGVMYGVVDFYRAMKDAGIHPGHRLRGIRMPGHGRQDRRLAGIQPPHPPVRDAGGLSKSHEARQPGVHPRLLLPSARGLRPSEEALQGADRRCPRVSRATFQSYFAGRAHERMRKAPWRRSISTSSGRTTSLSSFRTTGLTEEKQVLPRLVKLAREMDIPMVATNDCHYLEREDAGRAGSAHVHPDGQDVERRNLACAWTPTSST